jgi:Oxidoreductase family, NAD-binding Rossmann fold
MAGKRLGVGVIGTGRWANLAHLPGWRRDERCEIVAVCDRELDRAAAAAKEFGAAVVTTDYRDLLDRDDIDIIDVVTKDSEHFEINVAAIEAGKHVLSEKPVAHDFRDVRQVADRAVEKGLKTKVGFTFRYSPAVRYLKDMIDSGSLGTPFIYNAYEQNSQWLNPATPLRSTQGDEHIDTHRDENINTTARASSERAGDRPLQVASLEGFASEVLGDVEGNEGNFHDGLWVQQVVNAVEISHHERRWVSLPLDEDRA